MNVLITGANRGIGLEFSRQYSQAGYQVIACCRAPDDAQELKNLASQETGNIRIHALDVADFKQISALAKTLSAQPIDILINNAGVYPEALQAGLPADSEQAWIQGFRVNAIAPMKMAQAFAPHLTQSQKKLVVNISSKMGSIDDNTSGGSYLYRASKAALNAISKSLAIDLASQAIKVIILHPGWVQTDMGGSNALINATQSVKGMRQIIEASDTLTSGCFMAYDGKKIPW